MKFKVKVDWWVHLIFAASFIMNIWAAAGLDVILAVIFTPLNVFLILPIWLNTYYLLGEGELLVKSGLGKGTRIAYSQITGVCETRNPISAPALSLDRLEIRYKAKRGSFFDTIIISPKDKVGFIEQLRIKNENIEVSDEKKPMSKSSKTTAVIAVAVSAVTLVCVVILFVAGLREPVVTIGSDHIQIRAMYGLTVGFEEIDEFSLLDQSMREIGAGTRINGFNGGAWRGHFTAGLLFVTPDSSPTIRIERNSGSTIFISFRDADRAMMLYEELTIIRTGIM